MITKKYEVSNDVYDKSIVEAANILKSGGTVAIPTETVYGLAASAFCDDAIAKIFIAKGRPQDNPLIVHIADIEQLNEVASEIPEVAYKLAEKFWPGPFTMVLKKGERVSNSVCGGLDTVAVRMPNNDIARDIIRNSVPLAAPSANISGKPSPTTANHVIDDLSGKVDAVIMAGGCSVGVESTVITLCTNPPKLLRPGAVTAEQIREILPDLVIDNAVLNQLGKDEIAASPGMKYKHYAPETEVVLVEADSKSFVSYVNAQENCCAVCFSEEEALIDVKKICYGSITSEESLAKNVFSTLRKVDDLGVKTVYIHAPEKNGVGLAVYNRLIRAAAFKVMKL